MKTPMEMATDISLCVRNLCAGYGGHAVIRDMSLPPMRSGRITALVGPNAAGKSTLLRAMACLIGARGEIRLGETDLMRLKPAERALTVGFMPQGLPNDVSLSVLEAVIAALEVTGAADQGRSTAERALAVLEKLGVSHLAPQNLDRLSGGQRQVAGLAQSIACEPVVLLLDEPTSALDPARQFLIMRSIRDYAVAGRIVVVVMHDLALAAQWADEMIVLSEGALHSAGPPADVLTPSMLAHVYDVKARVERCSRGRLQIMVDGIVPSAPPGPAAPARPRQRNQQELHS